MPKPIFPLLLIAASLVFAALIDFVLVPSFDAAILYAIPLVIGARYGSVRTVVVPGGIALALNVGSLYQDQVPIALWPLSIVAICLVVALAAQSADFRRRERRRAQEAEDTREQLREFMGMVVHDLRGPLTVAMGYTQIALRQVVEVGGDATHHPLTKAETALRTMRRLVEDLLDSTRIGGGRFAIRVAKVDLAELTRSVVEDQREKSAEHHLVLDAPPNISVECDSERLRQVLANLLSNAVKYSAAGTEVRASLRQADGMVLLSVTDQGVGIAPAQMPELFQPFSRLGRELQATGTGLGLYITKGIVEAHGGRIWVESTPGAGSTFFVSLPHRPALARETRPEPEARVDASSHPGLSRPVEHSRRPGERR